MKNVLALELRKAFRNRSFLAVVLIGCVLSLLSAWMCLLQYGQDTYYFQLEADSGYLSNPMLEVESFYTYWIVMESTSPRFCPAASRWCCRFCSISW